MSQILSIATAVPSYEHSQEAIANFMVHLLGLNETEEQKLSVLYRRSGIEKRYSVLPDYNFGNKNRFLYPNTSDLEPFPSIAKRMEVYMQEATKLATQVAQQVILQTFVPKSKITHLITVSCTGLAAPGLDIALVQSLELTTHTQRTSVNFMGCYAAIHGLKYADFICRSEPNAVVLVVCVELCTLHFQKENTPDNLTANLLFADGAAAALVCSDQHTFEYSNYHQTLKIKGFYSELLLHAQADMAWQLSSTGFLMTLSGYIPQLLQEGFKPLLEKALTHYGVSLEAINHWAIHPGGRKILDLVAKELLQSPEILNASYQILKQYGNMSSPTILFVIKYLWDNNLQNSNGENIFTAAFGPGLTMETMLLETVTHEQ